MLREKGDFEKACEVYWGEWVDVADCDLRERETPESILMSKDTMDNMPSECKTLVEVLLNIPEEMYLVNGKVKKTALFKRIVEAHSKWNLKEARFNYYQLARYLSVATR